MANNFANAQNITSNWQVEYGIGSIIKHKKLIAHLVTAHPTFTGISWQQSADPNCMWKQSFNFPDWGIAVSYQNFHNSTLGEVWGIQYQTTYYLLNRNAKNQLNFQVRTGLAINSNPLNLETNNKNVAMSSRLQLAEFFKLEYKYPQLLKQIGFHAGILLTHYSNASYKNPNFGINSLFVSAGINYQALVSTKYPTRQEKEKIDKQPLHFTVALFTGVHEAKAGLGDKPVFALSSYVSQKIGQKSNLQLGLDFYNSQALKDLADFQYHTQIEYPDRVLLDHKQIGFFAGHELIFNKISLETMLGYYLYNPLHHTPSVYEKIALKHHLNSDNLALGFSLKVHNFKAEYLLFGIYYTLKK